jgi:putative spermidine/putrescine transport system permease protein
VSSVPRAEPPPRVGPRRRLSLFFHRHEHGRLAALLAAPLAWLLLVYIGSLVLLLMAAFWDTEPFTNDVVRHWNLDNFRRIFEQDVYRDVAWRTIQMAALVTVADAVLAFPIAYYMARVASPRTRDFLVVAVLTPLWASYLVKAFAWNAMLGADGFMAWLLGPFGLDPPGDFVGLWLTFTYFWLPFMILPVYAGLERIPSSLLEASGDLGARSVRTFWRVTLPLAFPAVVAGSIFTFSLTLGDYILPTLIADQQFIGTVIYGDRSANLPVAAAFAMVPIAVMTVYLVVARRLGAFRAL